MTPAGKTATYAWCLRIATAIAAIVLVVRLWVIIPLFSPTTDEPAHIGAAVAMVEAHKAIATVSHPPLPRWVMAIPLWIDGARLPQCRGVTTVGKEDTGYAYGTQVLYHGPKRFDVLLTHVRRVMLIFPLLALFYLYRLTATLAGETAACAATVFFSVDPTLLGHGIWACSDVAGCAGTLAALFYSYRWIDRPTTLRAVAAGVAVGLGIALKFSGLFVIPALAVVALLEVNRNNPMKAVKPRLSLHWFVIAAAGFVALWASYAFDVGALGDSTVFASVPQWQHLPHWVLAAPLPMPSFFLGVLRLLAQNHVGLRSYLNGHVGNSGWWYYFPEVLLVKSTIGFGLALLIAIGSMIIAGRSTSQRVLIRLLAPIAVFAVFTLTAKYDLGIRYILPSIALLYGLIAWQLTLGKRKIVLYVLMLLSTIETAAAHPDYLSFFNVAAGGPAGGQRFALDSNLDWNQDLYRLADYVHAHPQLGPFSLRLTGERNGPLLHALDVDANALSRPAHGSTLLISKNQRLVDGRLPWLGRHQPITTVGTSIDVYDLRNDTDASEPPDTPAADDPRRN